MTAIDDGPDAKKAKLFVAPSVEEIAALREAEGLFSGRLSQLKTDEILREISPTQADKNELAEVLGTIRSMIKTLPKIDDIDLADIGESVNGSIIPIKMTPPSDKGLVRFLPPTRISLVDTETALKYADRVEAKVEFEMPKACLQEKDVWDERFFRKRAIYMAYIATVLIKRFTVTYRVVNGLRIKPIMVLSLGRFDISCDVKTEVEFAKRARFIPSRCNIHYNWWAQTTEDESPPAETTLYNAEMLNDQISFEKEHHDLVEKCGSLPPSLNDADRLFSLWIRQSCIQHFEHVGNFFRTYALTLLTKNRLPRLASAFQIFRLVLESIADGDLTTLEGFSETEWPAPRLTTTQGRNLLANVPPSAAEWLKYSAIRDCQILSKDLSNGVISTLVNKRSFLSLSHTIVLLPHDGALECVLKRNKNETRIAALSGDISTTATEYLILLLKNAITDRLVAVCPKSPIFKSWSPKQQPPLSGEVSGLGFGLCLSESETNNLTKVFRGPAADNDRAKRFKSLWGPKADERRFQDGQICVAAFFDQPDPLEGAIRHLLKLHGEIEKVEFFGMMENEDRANFGLYQKLSDGYAELEQVLRSNDLDLPLRITHLWPVSPSFRGTSSIPFSPKAAHLPKSANQYNVDVPESKSVSPHFSSNTVLLQLEGSSKWPQNINAIRKLRQAYHIRLAELLSSKFHMRTAVGDGGMEVICRFKGFLFTLKTVYHREQELMTETTDKLTGMLRIENTAESEAEELRTMIRPKLSMILSRMSSVEMSVCRLFRKWIGSHFFSFQVDPLISDLLVYSALRHDAAGQPGSLRNGFYRLMIFLSNFDFIDEPVFIIGGVGEVTELEAESDELNQNEIRDYFIKNRSSIFSKQGILISSKADPNRSLVTLNGPSNAVVKKLQLLALASRKKMEMDINDMECRPLSSLFVGSSKWFDVLVQLRPLRESKLKTQSETSKNKHRLEIPDWSTVKLVFNTFTRALGHVALFFANEHDQTVLGVKFRKIEEMKGLQGECLGGMAKDELGVTYLNKIGIVNDMRILAAQAIESISVQKEL